MLSHQVQWRLRGAVLVARLLPVLLCFAAAVLGAVRAAELAYAALAAEAAAPGTVLLVGVLRTRVRIGNAGVEVRGLRTRTYAWGDLADVHPTFGHRGVQLRFVDGSARTLPVPRRWGVAASDPEIEAAVQLIRTAAQR